MSASPTIGATASRELIRGFLSGGGELGAIMRAFPWETTPLGPPELWPQSLKMAIRIMLTSRQPIWIGWGEDLTYFYNDPYKSIIGGKHPWALGRPTREVWSEIWPQIGPMLDTALGGDQGTFVESQLLIMERNGYPEETYYTFSYSPIPNDDGTVGGIFCANSDDTQRVIGERQLALAAGISRRKPATRATGGTPACASAVALAKKSARPPVRDDLHRGARRLARRSWRAPSGIERGPCRRPGDDRRWIDPSPWPIGEVLKSQSVRIVPDLQALADDGHPVRPLAAIAQPSAALIPILPTGDTGRAGVLVVGLNPFRLFDDNYRGFLGLVAGQIAAAIANAQAYEEERRRAEALAELDRAKTAFFSNVSHEFRTPLTLMLGPIEDMLQDTPAHLLPVHRHRLETAHRNSLRLLKLVNSLLDFSRIEAGRIDVSFEPVDLAQADRENWRPTSSRRPNGPGSRCAIDCAALPRAGLCRSRHVGEDRPQSPLQRLQVHLRGRDHGRAYALRRTGEFAELIVRDTGVGIPQSELPTLFERFHRIEGQRSRSFEGSGIGLALVQELVKLHGGTIGGRERGRQGRGVHDLHSVRRRPSSGGPDRQGALAGLDVAARRRLRRGGAALASAGRRTGGRRAGRPRRRRPPTSPSRDGRRARASWSPTTTPTCATTSAGCSARDGRSRPFPTATQALAAIRAQQARSRADRRDDAAASTASACCANCATDPALARPARDRAVGPRRRGGAGRGPGRQGADDYLTKPFSARELIARVNANLEMARLRRETTRELRESEARFRNMAEHAPVMMWMTDPTGSLTYLNRLWTEFTGQTSGGGARLRRLGGRCIPTIASASRRDLCRGQRRARSRSGSNTGCGAATAAIAGRSAPPGRASATTASFSATSARSSTSPTARKPNKFCSRPTNRWSSASPPRSPNAPRPRRSCARRRRWRRSASSPAASRTTSTTSCRSSAAICSCSAATSRAIRAPSSACRRRLGAISRGSKLASQLLAFGRRQPLAPKVVNLGRLIRSTDDMLRRALGEGVEIETVIAGGLVEHLRRHGAGRERPPEPGDQRARRHGGPRQAHHRGRQRLSRRRLRSAPRRRDRRPVRDDRRHRHRRAASPPTSSNMCSSRSSPPSRRARAPASGSAWSTASSSSPAATSRSTASRARARPCASTCRARKGIGGRRNRHRARAARPAARETVLVVEDDEQVRATVVDHAVGTRLPRAQGEGRRERAGDRRKRRSDRSAVHRRGDAGPACAARSLPARPGSGCPTSPCCSPRDTPRTPSCTAAASTTGSSC